jgi:4-amino-4-deoxy-L-arabinose transferase-like glycosyltransferase
MSAPRPGVAAPPAWACRLLAAALIVAVTAGRVAFLARDCPLDLSPDEAHYYDWSRHLDWSYYSKGPLVAYLIRAGCAAAGAWSEHYAGSLMVAVRLPAVACGALLLVSLYVLTVQVFRREALAAAVVALALVLPVTSAGAALMTIDAPYTCCWGWALVLVHRAVFRGSAWAWPAAGIVVGLGVLAKYTMALFLPSLGLFLLTGAAHRRLLLRPGFWAMAAVAGLCCLPILIWNMRNGWATFFHVENLSGVTDRGVRWAGPLAYVGGQCALLLGFWFAAWLAAMAARRPWAEPDAGARCLWWLSAPMFLTFLAFSFKTGGGELNWPVTAYLSGLVLAAEWLARQLESPRTWRRRVLTAALAGAVAVSGGATLLMHHTEWARPLLVRLVGAPTAANPCPLRKLDPTCRLRGWRALAAEVDRLRAQLRAEGCEPVLAGSGWSLPGELGVYCAGRPQVYSLGLAMGDRHSQYDLWRPNPLADADAFRGRTFLVVGGAVPELLDAFESVEPPQRVTYTEDGVPVAEWFVTVCRGYRGFPPPGKGKF